MTRREINDVLKILVRIKEPDGFVQKAIAICNKQIAAYNSRRGRLKEQYEMDDRWKL